MITMGHACGAERGPNRQQPPPVFPNPSQSHQLQTLILILTGKKEYNVYIFIQKYHPIETMLCKLYHSGVFLFTKTILPAKRTTFA